MFIFLKIIPSRIDQKTVEHLIQKHKKISSAKKAMYFQCPGASLQVLCSRMLFLALAQSEVLPLPTIETEPWALHNPHTTQPSTEDVGAQSEVKNRTRT